jgi:hypothetical protein
MKRLNEEGSLEKHIRASRYHIRLCRQRKAEALFVALATEAEAARSELIARARALEDQQRLLDDLGADFDYAELTAEDAVRDLDADLEKLDRQHPTLSARRRIFPDGYGAVIDIGGEAQLAALEATRLRLKALQEQPALSGSLSRLDAAISALKEISEQRRLQQQQLAERQIEERSARTALRQQLVDAHGRLRSYFKASPALADRFFLKSIARKTPKAEAKARAEALLLLLEARGLECSEEQKRRIQGATDLGTLSRWLVRAAAVASVEGLFAKPAEAAKKG